MSLTSIIENTIRLSNYLLWIACGLVVIVAIIICWYNKRRHWKRLQDRLNYISVHFHHISKEYMLPLSPNKEYINIT